MKVIVAADHAGFDYKQLLAEKLGQEGYDVVDMGPQELQEDDDYPDYAWKVAIAITNEVAQRGILICGSAVGVSIAANKFPGIRAGVCSDTYTAHQCVEHDNVNILCLGQRVMGINVVFEIAATFLAARFSNEERHERRLGKIAAIELNNMKETIQ